MEKLFVLLSLFATVWQVHATDWGTRVAQEQQWLIESLTPPAPEKEQVQDISIAEDSISTGQAAVQKENTPSIEEALVNPWDIRNPTAPKFQPSRKRSR